MIELLIVVLLVMMLLGLSPSVRTWHGYGFSPVGVILAVLLVLVLLRYL